jgi:cell wall-associated NlpC family hydrolase
VLVLAGALGAVPTLSAGRAGVVLFAGAALGLPYLWGGNGPGAYDCSGLVVAAFRSVGVALPRTAQEQFNVSMPASTTPTPGDLVFFGSGPTDVGHVGIVISPGLMIDAPHTGAFIRIESYAWSELIARRSA